MSEDTWTIFPPYEAFYIDSLLSCTESALLSIKWVSDFLDRYSGPDDDFSRQEVLNHLQNISLQGAAISRFFWPSDKKYKKRGNYLRCCFGLTEISPLKSRELRNHMEHYDEYLDDYFSETSLVGVILPDYVGPQPENDRVPHHLFRAFYTNTGRVDILGVSFELQPLVNAIVELHEILLECDQHGSRFPKKEVEPALPANPPKADG